MRSKAVGIFTQLAPFEERILDLEVKVRVKRNRQGLSLNLHGGKVLTIVVGMYV